MNFLLALIQSNNMNEHHIVKKYMRIYVYNKIDSDVLFSIEQEINFISLSIVSLR